MASELCVQHNLCRKQQQCVIAGDMNKWKAMHKWQSVRWWIQTHGHRTVPVELGRDGDSTWKEATMSLHDFMTHYVRPSLQQDPGASTAYIAQHPLFEQLPDLTADFDQPSLMAGETEQSNAWIGTAGTVTPLHFDSYDNFLCQVRNRAVGSYRAIVSYRALASCRALALSCSCPLHCFATFCQSQANAATNSFVATESVCLLACLAGDEQALDVRSTQSVCVKPGRCTCFTVPAMYVNTQQQLCTCIQADVTACTPARLHDCCSIYLALAELHVHGI